MKKIFLIFIGSLGLCVEARERVDEMLVLVNKVPICQSDVDERQVGLGGNCRTLKGCIQDELLYQKARTYNVIMSDEDLEKRLVALREGYGFGYRSQAEFEAFVRKTGGLSPKRLREQVRRSGAVAMVEHALLPKGAVVAREDVEAYCAKHPLEKAEEYLLSFASIPLKDLELDGSIPEGYELSWTELDGWMAKPDLGATMKFVASMKVGEVSKPVVRDEACFVYRLEGRHEKRSLTVDERYAEVEQLLLKGRVAAKEAELKQRMWDEAAITYLTK